MLAILIHKIFFLPKTRNPNKMLQYFSKIPSASHYKEKDAKVVS